jgi:predicted nucleic acid-binding protein
LTAAVLDACVLVPASLRDTLLRLAYDDLFTPYWSISILREVERTLITNGLASVNSAARLLHSMTIAFPQASVPSDIVERLTRSMTNQPKDRHVLAAAVAVSAPVIVTFNLKDFPSEALALTGVQVQTPDEFLIPLLEADPECVLDLLRQQAVDLVRPPMSLAQVLDNLALHAPSFVALVREALLAAD